VTTEDRPAGAEGFEVRIGWRRNDARLEADAIALWERTGILPDDVTPAERARELVAGAYQDGQLISLCTAVVEPIPFLRARFVVLRSMTDPDHRRSHGQFALALPVRKTLEEWALANPAEQVAGVIGFVEPGAWGDFDKLPVAPIWPLTVVAYTHDGKQVRACWFDHFRLDGAPPGESGALPLTAEEMAPGFEFRPAWRLNDPQIEKDAVDFWNRLGILPRNVTPEERARELIAVAYRDGRIVGVHTAKLGRLDQVRARLAMLRSAVDPDCRRTRVSFALTLYTRALLERWSKEHPEERLGGLGAILESRELAGRGNQPYWPTTRFILAGFMPDGRQLRVSWFEDFRLD
jgi:hypothetical protein